jgi:CheY-like chemotaxis protein
MTAKQRGGHVPDARLRRQGEERVEAPRSSGKWALLRLLIIDDDSEFGAVLGDFMRLDGCEVEVAADGPTGLVLARERRPHVIFCDLDLPGMSGLDIARALCADAGQSRPHLVAISGYSRPQDCERAAQAGFDDHVPKPVSPEDLDASLERFVSTRWEARQSDGFQSARLPIAPAFPASVQVK